jgi:hypothetical protein
MSQVRADGVLAGGLTDRLAAAILIDVNHAGSQTRMAMMRALLAGAAVPLAVCA